jgi:uncharacterized membrane protein
MASPSTRTTAFDRLLTDRRLGWAALVLLAAVIVAILRGRADWSSVPALVWLHLATMGSALALTPVMLVRRKGDFAHRALGYVWVSALLGTAVMSFWMRYANHGRFSFIHLISVFVLVQLPFIVLRARRHDVAGHRKAVRGMVIGALLIAGFFTFPFDRLLGHWLFVGPQSTSAAASVAGG